VSRPRLLPPGATLLPGGATAVDWTPAGYRYDPAAPLALLVADASVNHAARVAAWAAWGGCRECNQLWTGPIAAEESRDPSRAELRAISNGLAHVVRCFQPRPGSFVIIKSDSMAALYWTAGIHVPPSPATRAVVSEIHALLAEHAIGIRCRHVRGHQMGAHADPIQDAVDRAAHRARMRLQQTRRA
jgi:hypothetical protein